jgi:subtilisin family serine protease
VAPASEYVIAKTELVLDEIQAEEDNWVAGLEWLDSMGCDIVSSSLGYANWYTDDDFDGNTALSTIAADLAASRGVLVVNAAGNEGCGDGDIRLIVPADGDSVLTVGASKFDGDPASFSSCGPTSDGRIKPDVIAPGVGVWTALPNTGFYQPGNGTSFATPIVSGLCALLLEQTPTLTPWDLIELLRSTADRASKPLVTYGWGLVQAVDAADLQVDTITPNRQFDCERTGGDVVIWPNPAADRAVIDFEGGTQSDGVFRVFTVSGALVYEGLISSGRGEWNGETTGGNVAAPAVYLVHVVTENHNEVIKLAWLPRD